MHYIILQFAFCYIESGKGNIDFILVFKLSRLQKRLKQVTGAKNKLADQMDKLYDEIEEIETLIEEVETRLYNIRQEKIFMKSFLADVKICNH